MKGKNNLQRLNEELENYFRNTIIPQLFVDGDLILRKFTPPAMKQFNLTSADLGRSIIELVDNFRFSTFIENIQSVCTSSEILEKEIQTNDRRWYQMNIIPYIRMHDGRIDGVIVTFVDITRRIEDLKDLEKLMKDYEIMLDTLSHDLKNPLANLALTIELFKEKGLSDMRDFNKLIEVMDMSLSVMQNLITEMRESREQEYKYSSYIELLNFEHIMEDVRLTLSEEILRSGAVLTTDFHVTEITFSRRNLRSIMFNLLNNSMMYKSPERLPHITIRTFRENGCTVISVTDNGIGIDPEMQDSVFKKYFRVDNTGQGSGIGLYLVKEMIVNAGGKIQLESQPGEGTEIKIFLKEK